MSSTLTVQAIQSRLSQFPHDQYLYIGGFMRSVALAAGTLVLLEILLRGRKYWPRLLPWLVALGATLVTLETWGRGVLLTNSRANVRDAVIPTLMGIMEFCLFAILAPRRTVDDKGMQKDVTIFEHGTVEPWHLWPFLNAIHALLAVFLVLNRISNTDPINDYAPNLRPLAAEYVSWMWNDVSGAGRGVVVFSVIGVLTILLVKYSARKSKVWPKYVCSALAIVPIVFYSIVVYQANGQRERTETVVFSLAPEPPSK